MSVRSDDTNGTYRRAFGSQLPGLRSTSESLPLPQMVQDWLSRTSAERGPPAGCSAEEFSPGTRPYGNRIAGLVKQPTAAEQVVPRLTTWPPASAQGARDPPTTTDSFELLVGTGVGIGCLLVENFLSLPFVVLRRQCQVNSMATRCHRTPFTLAPVVYNLQLNQGIHCFWKGVSSSIVTRGLDILFDTVLADLLGLPRTLTNTSTLAKLICHFFLKSISYALATPFTVASFIDTVQTNAVRGKPGIFDCVTEGFSKLSADLLGPRDGRRFGIFYLAIPSVLHRLSHYIMFNATRSYMYSVVKRWLRNKPATERSAFDQFFPEVFTAFTSNLLAEAVLYPMGTVVYRLYLQGSRVIIDNMDSGSSVVPINTTYEGLTDCIRTMYSQEGVKGFYKGFGALILQYMIHLALVHGLRKLFLYLERHRPSSPVLCSYPEEGTHYGTIRIFKHAQEFSCE